MKRRLVLKNKRRFAAFIMILAVMIIFGRLIIDVTASSDRNSQDIGSNYVIVNEGDTLWEIALDNKPDCDIRYYIYQIKELNHIESDNIYKGQKIILP